MSDYDPAEYGERWRRDYDRLFGSREDPTDMIAGLERLVPGRTILELGVGTGRLAIPLHDAGWRVVGVDASDSMLDQLARSAGDRAIEAHKGDMRSVDVGRRFDVVLVAFSTMFLLPDQASQVEMLATAARHRAEHGVVVVEAFVPDHTRWSDGRRLAVARWDDERVELEAARHDRATQVIEVRYLDFGDASVRIRPLRLRYAWPSEIDLMAQLVGMRRVARWAAWNGSAFDAASPGHISVYGA